MGATMGLVLAWPNEHVASEETFYAFDVSLYWFASKLNFILLYESIFSSYLFRAAGLTVIMIDFMIFKCMLNCMNRDLAVFLNAFSSWSYFVSTS